MYLIHIQSYPPPPPIVWIWYLIFFWTEKKFWETKRKQKQSFDRWRHQHPIVYPIPSHPNICDSSFKVKTVDNILQF